MITISKVLALVSVPVLILILLIEKAWVPLIFYISFCLCLLIGNIISRKTQDLPDSLTKILKQQNRYRE